MSSKLFTWLPSINVFVAAVSTPLVRLMPLVSEFHVLDSAHGTSMRNIRTGVVLSVASTVYNRNIALVMGELKGTCPGLPPKMWSKRSRACA